jgi:hypothetical protein
MSEVVVAVPAVVAIKKKKKKWVPSKFVVDLDWIHDQAGYRTVLCARRAARRELREGVDYQRKRVTKRTKGECGDRKSKYMLTEAALWAMEESHRKRARAATVAERTEAARTAAEHPEDKPDRFYIAEDYERYVRRRMQAQLVAFQRIFGEPTTAEMLRLVDVCKLAEAEGFPEKRVDPGALQVSPRLLAEAAVAENPNREHYLQEMEGWARRNQHQELPAEMERNQS